MIKRIIEFSKFISEKDPNSTVAIMGDHGILLNNEEDLDNKEIKKIFALIKYDKKNCSFQSIKNQIKGNDKLSKFN